MTVAILDTGVKPWAFHFMYLYLTNKPNWFLQVSPQPLGFEGGVLLFQQPPWLWQEHQSSTRSWFRPTRSLRYLPRMPWCYRTAPSCDSLHPGNASAHPICTPKKPLQIRAPVLFRLKSCPCTPNQNPKGINAGLTLKLAAEAGFIKPLSINLGICMQGLSKDPDCQQFPTAPFPPFRLPNFRFIICNFLLLYLFTAVLPWGDRLPEAEMFAQICASSVSSECAAWK